MVIGVWEKEKILSALLAQLCPAAKLCSAKRLPSGKAPDLLILSPDLPPTKTMRGSCQALLLPGALSSLAKEFSARWVVSCGGNRDTLALSFLTGNTFGLSVQRDILSLTGERIERQELCLPRKGALSPPYLLLLAGAQLLLGVPPERVLQECLFI